MFGRVSLRALLVGRILAVAVGAVGLCAFLLSAVLLTVVSTDTAAAEVPSQPSLLLYQPCASCHPDQATRIATSAHAPLGCLRCHGAHQQPGLSHIACSPTVCYDCHADWTDTRHFHPHDPTYYDELADRPLTCTSSCHDVHGTSHSYLLRHPYEEAEAGGDDLCMRCHSEVGVEE